MGTKTEVRLCIIFIEIDPFKDALWYTDALTLVWDYLSNWITVLENTGTVHVKPEGPSTGRSLPDKALGTTVSCCSAVLKAFGSSFCRVVALTF